MARWEPDAEHRLRRAALDLFTERGYDQVTVSDISERAGLTRRSFFRYFPDKREVLFAGSDRLAREIELRLDAAPSDEPVTAAVIRVLTEAGQLLMQNRGGQQQRRGIIAGSPELKERDRTKIAAIAAAVARSLARRGIKPDDAQLLGAVWAELFRSAYDRALTDDASVRLGQHLLAAVDALKSLARDSKLTT